MVYVQRLSRFPSIFNVIVVVVVVVVVVFVVVVVAVVFVVGWSFWYVTSSYQFNIIYIMLYMDLLKMGHFLTFLVSNIKRVIIHFVWSFFVGGGVSFRYSSIYYVGRIYRFTTVGNIPTQTTTEINWHTEASKRHPITHQHFSGHEIYIHFKYIFMINFSSFSITILLSNLYLRRQPLSSNETSEGVSDLVLSGDLSRSPKLPSYPLSTNIKIHLGRVFLYMDLGMCVGKWKILEFSRKK